VPMLVSTKQVFVLRLCNVATLDCLVLKNASDCFTSMHRQMMNGGKKNSHSVFTHKHSVSIISENKFHTINMMK